MKLLLGSGGIRTPERVAVWTAEMRAVLGSVRRVLFLPFALADHDGYLRMILERGLNAGYELESLHTQRDPGLAARRAEAIFVGGGNTFRLLAALYRLELLEPIRERVRAGVPYLGVSAGTNVACPTIKTTNDMPIVQPPSFDALGLISFQINPHYFPGGYFIRDGDDYREHFGETRDDRLREFHEENDMPVVGLWEGGVLRIEGERIDLIGAAVRVFRKGEPALDVQPGADLAPLLAGSRA